MPSSTIACQDYQQERCSLMKSQDKRIAKKVYFYRNGDKYFRSMVWPISTEKFRTWESLLVGLTKSPLGDKNVLPQGVRHIFTIDGNKINSIEELIQGQSYICSSTATFKKINYFAIGSGINGGNSSPYTPPSTPTMSRRLQQQQSISFNKQTDYEMEDSLQTNIKPKLITIIRNGTKPRRAIRILLNKKTAHNFNQVLGDINKSIDLNSGNVKKIYNLEGKLVNKLEDFFIDENSVFIAYGQERYCLDDFELDEREVKHVVAYKPIKLKERAMFINSPKMSRRGSNSSNVANNGNGRKDSFMEADQQERILSLNSPKQIHRAVNGNSTTNGVSSNSNGNSNQSNSELEIDDEEQDKLSLPEELLKEYQVKDKFLARGKYANIKECKKISTDKTYLLKIHKDCTLAKGQLFLSSHQLRHSNIIEIITDFTNSERRVLFIMEDVRNAISLYESIQQQSENFTEKDASSLLFNLFSALNYLHSKSIINRNVNLDNLIVFNQSLSPAGTNSDKVLKIADFSQAAICENGNLMFDLCSNENYRAPEILSDDGYGCKIDIWAAGVLTFLILCGSYPTGGEWTNDYSFHCLSSSAKDFIESIMEVNSINRFTALEALNHPWISDDTALSIPLDVIVKLKDTCKAMSKSAIDIVC